jgi:hypothetical protein
MKIYVASSWRNTVQPLVVEAFRNIGHIVYDFKNPPEVTGFAWSEIDENWQDWSTGDYAAALEHPRAVQGFEADFGAMLEADICILVLPCGRSAHTEAGYMSGDGKPVFVYVPAPIEPELMYKVFAGGIHSSLDELIKVVGAWTK